MSEMDPRRLAIARFARARFGLRGTLALHRAALGWDLLRAPVNLLLAPVFLVIRLGGLVAGWLGWQRGARWLARREVFWTTAVSREVAREVAGFIDELERGAHLAPVDPRQRDRAVADYAGTRGAVAEITTMLVLLTLGFVLFRAVTPGVVSLTGAVTELRVHAQAVEGFPLGPFIGRAWYSVFPVRFGIGDLVVTGLALAVASSVLTTFAGLIADPVQVALGLHQRRLARLVARIEAGAEAPGLAGEHVAARVGDISDAALTIWRSLR